MEHFATKISVMKRSSMYTFILFLLSFPCFSLHTSSIERRKTIIKIYDIDTFSGLYISNAHGLVKVNLWDKDEVQVKITVIAKSSSEDIANFFLDRVNILEKKTFSEVMLTTNISQLNTGYTRYDNETLRINYEIYMPKKYPLSIQNKFGDIEIPVFYEDLTVDQHHGNFIGTSLLSNRNSINVNYGKIIIDLLKEGKIESQYTDIRIKKANSINLKGNYGEIYLGEIGSLQAEMKYSNNMNIGVITESANIKLRAASNFRIREFGQRTDKISINAQYSDLSIPINKYNNSVIDLSLSHSSINYTGNNDIFFEDSRSLDSYYNSKNNKHYSLKLGNGKGPDIKVEMNYSTIKLK